MTKKNYLLLCTLITIALCFTSKAIAQYTWKLAYSADATSYAIRNDGTLWSCGWNDDFQLGYSTKNDRSSEWKAMSEDHDWVMIAGARGTAYFLKSNGTLWTVGSAEKGAAGIVNGNLKNKQLTQIGTSNDWVYVASAHFWGHNGFAIKKDGTLWGWGEADSGQLLSTNGKKIVTEPIQIGTDKDWKKVVCGESSVLALKTDGTLWAWGSNSDYNLGLGNNSPQFITKKPIQVGNDKDWNDVFIISRRSYAIKKDGTLWGCGSNDKNFLLTSLTEGKQPEVVANFTKVMVTNDKVITVQGYEQGIVLGIGNDNNTIKKILIWGINEDGFLGNGEGKMFNGDYDDIPFTDTPLTPHLPKEERFSSISAGQAYVMAITTNGEMYVWGRGKGGQLGNKVDYSMMMYNFVTTPIKIPCPQNVIGENPFNKSQIKLVTTKQIGETIAFHYKANGNIKVNGVVDNGDGTYTLKSQTVIVEGNITEFDASNNGLSQAEAYNMTELKTLALDDNQITTINFLNLPKLKTLYIGSNKLNNLNVTQLTSLEDLSFWGNEIETINLKNNTRLTSLVCRDCKLQGVLDLSPLKKLNYLNANNNAITAIKLPTNKEGSMQHMECMRNAINSQQMTELIAQLPQYKELLDWDDYMGMNKQGLYLLEHTDMERNWVLKKDVEVAKSKGWPVWYVTIENQGVEAPIPYEGEASSFSISLKTEGEGKLSINEKFSTSSYPANQPVSFTVQPKVGYKLAELLVNNKTWDYKKPYLVRNDIEVLARFVQDNAVSFVKDTYITLSLPKGKQMKVPFKGMPYVKVYTTKGVCIVAQKGLEIDLSWIPEGFYILSIGNKNVKLAI